MSRRLTRRINFRRNTPAKQLWKIASGMLCNCHNVKLYAGCDPLGASKEAVYARSARLRYACICTYIIYLNQIQYGIDIMEGLTYGIHIWHNNPKHCRIDVMSVFSSNVSERCSHLDDLKRCCAAVLVPPLNILFLHEAQTCGFQNMADHR